MLLLNAPPLSAVSDYFSQDATWRSEARPAAQGADKLVGAGDSIGLRPSEMQLPLGMSCFFFFGEGADSSRSAFTAYSGSGSITWPASSAVPGAGADFTVDRHSLPG